MHTEEIAFLYCVHGSVSYISTNVCCRKMYLQLPPSLSTQIYFSQPFLPSTAVFQYRKLCTQEGYIEVSFVYFIPKSLRKPFAIVPLNSRYLTPQKAKCMKMQCVFRIWWTILGIDTWGKIKHKEIYLHPLITIIYF